MSAKNKTLHKVHVYCGSVMIVWATVFIKQSL